MAAEPIKPISPGALEELSALFALLLKHPLNSSQVAKGVWELHGSLLCEREDKVSVEKVLGHVQEDVVELISSETPYLSEIQTEELIRQVNVIFADWKGLEWKPVIDKEWLESEVVEMTAGSGRTSELDGIPADAVLHGLHGDNAETLTVFVKDVMGDVFEGLLTNLPLLEKARLEHQMQLAVKTRLAGC